MQLFSKFINSSARMSVSTRSSAHLFVSALVCPWPLVNTFLSASIAQLLVKFSTSASAYPQGHKLAHQCVSSYGHLSIYALLTHTRESVVRALGNLSVCAPLSGQSPAWARWERASLDGTRAYCRRSSIYIRTIIVRYLNNSWPLLVVSRRLLVILMSHQQVTQKDVADNHFRGRPIMPEMPKNWMGSSMDT